MVGGRFFDSTLTPPNVFNNSTSVTFDDFRTYFLGKLERV